MYSQMLVQKHTVPIFSDSQGCTYKNKPVELYFHIHTTKQQTGKLKVIQINSKVSSHNKHKTAYIHPLASAKIQLSLLEVFGAILIIYSATHLITYHLIAYLT